MTQTILKTPNRFWLSAPKENKNRIFWTLCRWHRNNLYAVLNPSMGHGHDDGYISNLVTESSRAILTTVSRKQIKRTNSFQQLLAQSITAPMVQFGKGRGSGNRISLGSCDPLLSSQHSQPPAAPSLPAWLKHQQPVFRDLNLGFKACWRSGGCYYCLQCNLF